MLPSGEALSKLIGALYDAAGDPGLWDPFLQQLAHSTGATSAALVLYDTAQDAYALSTSWKVDPGATLLYQQHYGSIDIWARRALSKPAGYVGTSQELCPVTELAATEVYNDFMVEFGFEHGLFGLVENNRSRFASLSLYRDSSRPAFQASELELLDFLAPHVQRAFKLHLQFSELKNQSAGLVAALDMLPTGVILLGTKGDIVQMNRSASALLSEKDGLLATRDGLGAEQPTESNLLARAVHDATSASKKNSSSVGGTVLISRRTRPPLQILISPVRNSTISGISVAPHVAGIAFITDPSRRQRPTQDILRALFGLTPAECRVALLLGDGHAPRKIANMVGVTDNTVRSQMKSIFSKTGVKRQGELIRLLSNNSGLAIQAESAR